MARWSARLRRSSRVMAGGEHDNCLEADCARNARQRPEAGTLSSGLVCGNRRLRRAGSASQFGLREVGAAAEFPDGVREPTYIQTDIAASSVSCQERVPIAQRRAAHENSCRVVLASHPHGGTRRVETVATRSLPASCVLSIRCGSPPIEPATVSVLCRPHHIDLLHEAAVVDQVLGDPGCGR